jgi:hypothetical protein
VLTRTTAVCSGCAGLLAQSKFRHVEFGASNSLVFAPAAFFDARSAKSKNMLSWTDVRVSLLYSDSTSIRRITPRTANPAAWLTCEFSAADRAK